MNITRTRGDKVFDSFNILLCVLIFLITLYPLIYVVSASFSNPLAVLQGRVALLPKDITFDSYKKILSYPNVLTGYRNSLILVVVGTCINLLMTLLGAYPLSRKDFYGRKPVTMLFAFTMFFSGGMIPTYLVVQRLGLLDSMWSMILPGAVQMYNLVVMRTFFQTSIPESLIEAAYMDGASNMQVLFRVVLPLSKAVIAVICLFYGVAHSNQYFQALIYISDKAKYPLQMILREILLMSQVQELVDMQGFEDQLLQAEGIKYSLIIVSSVPVLLIYPFAQKYFVQGVMLGAIKE